MVTRVALTNARMNNALMATGRFIICWILFFAYALMLIRPKSIPDEAQASRKAHRLERHSMYA